MSASFGEPDRPTLFKLLGEKCGMPQEPEDSLREKGWKRKESGREKAWTGGSKNKTFSVLSIKASAYYLQQDAMFFHSIFHAWKSDI